MFEKKGGIKSDELKGKLKHIIKRGLYKTKEGKIINADMNAAFNMIRKYKSNTNEPKYLGFMCRGLTNPCRVRVSL